MDPGLRRDDEWCQMIDVSKFAQTLNGKPVAVYGLGISNLAAIRALRAEGVAVIAGDDQPERLAAAQEAGAETLAAFADQDFTRFACLVLAPGVPLTHPEPHPVVAKAQAAGIEILCDLEILHRAGHGRRTIGITGTNGKSTTTVLVAHILNACGIQAVAGGNIGIAALAMDLPGSDGVFVLEMSSFQIDLCPTFAPDIAVHLNITPDHLDRHKTLENYAETKMRIFRGPGEAVIGIDDEPSLAGYARVKAEGQRRCIPISVRTRPDGGVFVQDGGMFDAMDGAAREVFRLNINALPGVHNHQNAAAAYTVCRLMGLEAEAIYEAMKSFPGLNHRQYLVRVINGVAYVNDSKATNADATARALECYRGIYWIAGGLPKDGGLNGLDAYLDRIRHAFVIGQAAEDFAAWLENRGVAVTIAHRLDTAVAAAHAMAQSERGQPGGMGTVLLSPACASYDQFSSFAARGDAFAALVQALPEEP